MFKLNGKKISIDRDLVIGAGDEAITYPAASLQNAELRTELGIVEVPAPVRPDDRLFLVTENEDGSFTTAPRPVDQVMAPVWDQIKGKRDDVKVGGVLVAGKWFHTDSDSRTQYLGLKDEARDVLAAGDSMDSPLIIDGAAVVWKTMDGSFIPVTAQLAFEIVAAAKVLDKRAFAAAEMHRAAAIAAENPFEYDFSAGWPSSFSEEQRNP
ncbi:DUF4376 domain-containing protein [Azonexus sp. R2A61]|uniref:DUF4376 domain-containing protein n=1 Tax=Azonexus sp. R2A61 TaxID=2744443 RepID=UPI001F1E47F4|nr:DUF4376 domain-containing protein [Azonexus sp. R2A61]